MNCILCGSILTYEEAVSGHKLCYPCWSKETDRLFPPVKISTRTNIIWALIFVALVGLLQGIWGAITATRSLFWR
jgi:hypothetical protein